MPPATVVGGGRLSLVYFVTNAFSRMALMRVG